MHKFPAKTLFTGKQVINVPSCHSTNAHASALLAEHGLEEGTVIITPNQLSGRGQRGNVWEAEPHKNLTFSMVLKPTFLDIAQQFWLNAVVALGISDFLSQYISYGIKVKWPNDIYYCENKLGGILIENSIRKAQIESSIVGVGLNVNQREFKFEKAISMHTICGQSFELNELLAVILPSIGLKYQQLKSGSLKELREEYLNSLFWMSEEHIFKTTELVKGTIKDVDESGHLMVEIGSKLKKFNFKEIEFIE